jgi:AcrR family transcriptional regulator
MTTGVRRTSADDIARRAGINRATLYRRLGTKDEIVAAAILHETAQVLAAIEQQIGEVPPPGTPGFDPTAYVVRMSTVTVTAVRTNPLFHHLVATDRDETLVGLTERSGEVIALSSALVAGRIRSLRAYAGSPVTDDVDGLAAVLARLTQSLLLTPTGPPDLASPDRMAEFATTVIAPMVLRGTPGVVS